MLGGASDSASGNGSGEATGDVFTRAGDDPRLVRLFDRFVAELSFHLVNLAIAVDPARIAVGGGMVRSWDLLRPGLREALDIAVPFPRNSCAPRTRMTLR